MNLYMYITPIIIICVALCCTCSVKKTISQAIVKFVLIAEEHLKKSEDIQRNGI